MPANSGTQLLQMVSTCSQVIHTIHTHTHKKKKNQYKKYLGKVQSLILYTMPMSQTPTFSEGEGITLVIINTYDSLTTNMFKIFCPFMARCCLWFQLLNLECGTFFLKQTSITFKPLSKEFIQC